MSIIFLMNIDLWWSPFQILVHFWPFFFRGQKSSSTLRSGQFSNCTHLFNITSHCKPVQNWQWQWPKHGYHHEIHAKPSMPDLPEDQSSNRCFLWKRQRTNLASCWPESWPHITEGPNRLNLGGVQQGTAKDSLLVHERKVAICEDPILIPQQGPTNLFRRVS